MITVFTLPLSAADVIVFKPGQVWSYDSRENEPDSRIIICRAEPINGETVVHVVIDNLDIKELGTPVRTIDRIGHLPFAYAALAESVIKNLEVNEVPADYLIGYNQWRAMFDKGEASYIKISVKQALDHIQNAINGVEGH